jgi:hypothetical protein
MSNKEKSRQPSHRFNGYKSKYKGNDNKFSRKIHYKSFLRELPPPDMNKDQQYELMKKQIHEPLSPYEYDAAIKFICDLLNH